MIDERSIQENIRIVSSKIEEAAAKSSRKQEEILLIAITKTFPPEAIEAAIRSGIKVFGENRVQEAAEKIPRITADVVWHMVGHLQSNKAKIAVPLFDMIHSLDSIKLARFIDRAAQEAGKVQRCIVEVNLSGEASKFGMEPDGLKQFLEEAVLFKNIVIEGLMTIPPYDPDPERSRPYFRQLRELAREASGWGIEGITMKELSMGMTEDFPVAIEEGATMVRIGRAIFGERPS